MNALRAFLFSSFAFGASGLWAQEYIPFPESNASWTVGLGESYCFEIDPTSSQVYRYETQGDTTINDQGYHKLVVTAYCAECCVPAFRVGYAGAFRNDTAERTVMMVLPDSTYEVVLYDFGASIGDTMDFDYSQQSWCGPYGLQSIDSVWIVDTYRRRFTWSTQGCWWNVAIEGVGSMNGLLEWSASNMEYGGQLLCQKVDGTVVYEEMGSGGCLVEPMAAPNVVGTDHRFVLSVQNGTVQTRFSDGVLLDGFIEIHDAFGRLMNSLAIVSRPTATIPLSHSAAGVYFIRYTASSTRRYASKLSWP
ncbi:MAG: T9SS type A sorting domain-containing protein [Flavobacteriales bacterium]|nr:T9SS type A sorting domain-containing protein [Flavobacteriales bacterium]